MPWLLYPWGKSPWYPVDRRLDGPRAGLDAVTKRKNPCPCWKLRSTCPACSLDTILTELPYLLKRILQPHFGSNRRMEKTV